MCNAFLSHELLFDHMNSKLVSLSDRKVSRRFHDNKIPGDNSFPRDKQFLKQTNQSILNLKPCHDPNHTFLHSDVWYEHLLKLLTCICMFFALHYSSLIGWLDNCMNAHESRQVFLIKWTVSAYKWASIRIVICHIFVRFNSTFQTHQCVRLRSNSMHFMTLRDIMTNILEVWTLYH